MEALESLKYLLLAVFGLTGIFARFGITSFAVKSLGFAAPAATVVINIAGSFLIGLTYAIGIEKMPIGEDIQTALVSGLLGGFTTFSAFSFETVSLLSSGRHIPALLYIAVSVVGGILAALAGLYVGKLI